MPIAYPRIDYGPIVDLKVDLRHEADLSEDTVRFLLFGRQVFLVATRDYGSCDRCSAGTLALADASVVADAADIVW